MTYLNFRSIVESRAALLRGSQVSSDERKMLQSMDMQAKDRWIKPALIMCHTSDSSLKAVHVTTTGLSSNVYTHAKLSIRRSQCVPSTSFLGHDVLEAHRTNPSLTSSSPCSPSTHWENCIPTKCYASHGEEENDITIRMARS